jgi:hypothetical protein
LVKEKIHKNIRIAAFFFYWQDLKSELVFDLPESHVPSTFGLFRERALRMTAADFLLPSDAAATRARGSRHRCAAAAGGAGCVSAANGVVDGVVDALVAVSGQGAKLLLRAETAAAPAKAAELLRSPTISQLRPEKNAFSGSVEARSKTASAFAEISSIRSSAFAQNLARETLSAKERSGQPDSPAKPRPMTKKEERREARRRRNAMGLLETELTEKVYHCGCSDCQLERRATGAPEPPQGIEVRRLAVPEAIRAIPLPVRRGRRGRPRIFPRLEDLLRLQEKGGAAQGGGGGAEGSVSEAMVTISEAPREAADEAATSNGASAATSNGASAATSNGASVVFAAAVVAAPDSSDLSGRGSRRTPQIEEKMR